MKDTYKVTRVSQREVYIIFPVKEKRGSLVNKYNREELDKFINKFYLPLVAKEVCDKKEDLWLD